LVHDSQLFDGVDPRQTGRALAVGARLAQENGFQYLVTLNSDVLSELPAAFEIKTYLLPQTMTDATESGGLFGIRFEPPRGDQPDTGARRRRQPQGAVPRNKTDRGKRAASLGIE
jgi:hypothetical protein